MKEQLHGVYIKQGNFAKARELELSYKKYLFANRGKKSCSLDNYEILHHRNNIGAVEFVGQSLKVSDVSSPVFNSCKGYRKTIPAPSGYTNSVYIFGDSKMAGTTIADEDTFGNLLQGMFNERHVALRVVQCAAGGSPIENIYLNFLEQPFVAGDWAVFQYVNRVYGKSGISDVEYYKAIKDACEKNGVHFRMFCCAELDKVIDRSPLECESPRIHDKYNFDSVYKRRELDQRLNILLANGVPCYNTQSLFDRPHIHGEVFLDRTHLSHVGLRVTVKYLYELWFSNQDGNDKLYAEDVLYNDSLQCLGKYFQKRNPVFKQGISKYINEIKNPVIKKDARVGSIVMNCNPFTLGHQYIIEYAAEKVDHLYIFVVQEDKSFFSFKDRFKLVQEGTRHLGDKICVVPGGSFIISSITFNEYFSKDNVKTKVDPTNDVMIFGTIIAPALGVNVRFLGEEPKCNVTKQYNEAIYQALPKLGIEVEIIPRKAHMGNAISASSVRQYLQQDNFEEISRIVPKTTYDHLVERYGK